MEHEKLDFVHNDVSIFAGAIFMSNRSTKLECLQRKLFGLPHSKSNFLREVKAGMILFLFEYEERKLYGLFEATSDGALNIIPDAFKSTGQSYPAQILFKRIWICRPLCEDEFRCAIEENYYSPNKFHFGLSYGQVKNLIHLFYLKRINLKHHDTGSGSNDVNLHSVVAQPSHPLHSYSQTINPQYSSIFLPYDHITSNHFPTGKQYSIEEMDYNKCLPRQSACYMPNLDDVTVLYDPDAPAIKLPCNNMIQRMAEIQAADVFKSFHVSNDNCPQIVVLQHTSLDGAQVNQLFELPDYIPLPEEPQQKLVDRENQNSSVENYEYFSSTALGSCIPSTCKEIPKAFHDVANADDDELNAFQRNEADDYPAVTVDGRLHSDSDLSRPSVFSRLSRDQNVYNQEIPEACMGLTLEQLFNRLATRRKLWSIRKIPKQFLEWGSNEQYDCTTLTEPSDQISGHKNKFSQITVQPVGRSNNDQYEGITETENVEFIAPLEYDQSSEDVTNHCFELPFYNFRRRNMSQKYKAQDNLNTCDNCGNETTVLKSKRRRIRRPSLTGGKQNEEKAEGMISEHMKEEIEVKIPSETILENENENQSNCGNTTVDCIVPGFQNHRKSEPEGESVEVAHATSVDGSEDYIPLG